MFLISYQIVVDLHLLSQGGGPHLDFEKAMEMEHCTGKGSHEYYVTNNYKIRTCPYDEWCLTDLHDLSKATSPEATAHKRIFVPIAELMKVEVAVQAGLTRHEVIAVVLYTGPMVSWLVYRLCSTLTIRCPS